jgi:trans-aconitate methyltransferase
MQPEANPWKVKLYNQKHAFVYEYGQELIQLLDPKKNELILDLGCGSGQLTYEIRKSGARVIGMDSSNEMISEAKNKYPDLQFFVKDAAEFQFEKPFDAIFSNAVLHWVKNKESAILSMYKNLKPGGRLVLEFGGKGNVKNIITSVKNSLESRGYIKNSSLENWYFPSISEYSSLLEKNGFEVVFAHLCDRPTELADDQNGIKDWIEMFGSSYFVDIPFEEKNIILEEIQNALREKCFLDGKWYADYRRIRVIAKKIN